MKLIYERPYPKNTTLKQRAALRYHWDCVNLNCTDQEEPCKSCALTKGNKLWSPRHKVLQEYIKHDHQNR